MRNIVIMPGGFHPFHAGHASLYHSAVKAFNDADTYVAATNDTKTRPFPFAIKEKLAKLAGVADKHFIQVKSPFQPREITDRYNPEEDVVIFVRSEKDKNESPKPGGTKKDGTPAYFQPWTGKNVQPFGKHAYIAYLPTVEFGPGITSATEIRNAWPKLDDRRKTAMVMSLYPVTQKNPKLAANVIKMLDMGMGTELTEDSLNELAPSTSGEGDNNYLKTLARAWYNMEWEMLGDLVKQGKNPLEHRMNVQDAIENMLGRGIHCPDGKVRKYFIGYNHRFDGVDIQSRDHYEYSDHDNAGRDIDSRTGKPWGPYDVIEFAGNELNESVAEGEVIPFKQPSKTLTWQQVPKDILLLANDWFWASEDNSGLDATLDPEGFGNGTANDVKYLTAKLQQKGWTIDYNYEYDGPGEFNLRLTNKRGQSVLLSIEDAQDFTGWAEGTSSLNEGPFVQRIVRPNKINIYVRHDPKKPALLVATDIPYTVYDKFILKAMQKYPQFTKTDFSFKSADRAVTETNLSESADYLEEK